MRRYTEDQEKLLKLNPKKLDEEELRQLHRFLLPRGSYLPDEPAEQDALAREWLGEEKYMQVMALCDLLAAHYGDKAQFSWSRGEKEWGMFRLVRVGKKSLCRIAIAYECFRLVIYYGASERAAFEKVRNTFPRVPVQWAYDAVTERKGILPLYFDVFEEDILPYVLRLLSIKCAPEIPFTETHL